MRYTDKYKGPKSKLPPITGLAPKIKKDNYSGRNNNAHDGSSKKPGGKINGLVNSQIRAGVDSLRQDRRIVRRQAKRDRSQANADYQRSLGDLDYIYGETQDYVGQMNKDINSAYTDQASRTAAAQQAFVAQLQQNSQNVGQGLSSELSRLGLQGTDNFQFAADAQNWQNLAGQMGMNDQSNIALQQQGANSVGSLLSGMVQGSHQSQVGQAMNAKNDTMFQIFQNKHDGFNEVAEAISDLKGTRGDLTQQMMEQLANSPWGRYLTRGKKRHGSGGYNDGGSYSGGSGFSNNSTPYSPSTVKGHSAPSGGQHGGGSLNDLLLGALNGGPRGPRRHK